MDHCSWPVNSLIFLEKLEEITVKQIKTAAEMIYLGTFQPSSVMKNLVLPRVLIKHVFCADEQNGIFLQLISIPHSHSL